MLIATYEASRKLKAAPALRSHTFSTLGIFLSAQEFQCNSELPDKLIKVAIIQCKAKHNRTTHHRL